MRFVESALLIAILQRPDPGALPRALDHRPNDRLELDCFEMFVGLAYVKHGPDFLVFGHGLGPHRPKVDAGEIKRKAEFDNQALGLVPVSAGQLPDSVPSPDHGH